MYFCKCKFDKMREIVRQRLLLKVFPKHGVKWYSLDVKAITSINYEITPSCSSCCHLSLYLCIIRVVFQFTFSICCFLHEKLWIGTSIQECHMVFCVGAFYFGKTKMIHASKVNYSCIWSCSNNWNALRDNKSTGQNLNWCFPAAHKFFIFYQSYLLVLFPMLQIF